MKSLFKSLHFSTLIVSIFILIFFIALNFNDYTPPPPSGWYQQFMPNLNGRQIKDITFTDSLNGYAITSMVSGSSYILKTTNSGDNWFISDIDSNTFNRIQFINQNTGFVGGYINRTNLVKTTNA